VILHKKVCRINIRYPQMRAASRYSRNRQRARGESESNGGGTSSLALDSFATLVCVTQNLSMVYLRKRRGGRRKTTRAPAGWILAPPCKRSLHVSLLCGEATSSRSHFGCIQYCLAVYHAQITNPPALASHSRVCSVSSVNGPPFVDFSSFGSW